MTLLRLLGALGGLEPALTADELADAIWLAQQRVRSGATRADRLRSTEQVGQAPATTPAPVPGTPGQAGAERVDSTADEPGESAAAPGRDASPAADQVTERRAGLYLPWRHGLEAGAIGLPTRSPAVPALPGSLAITRSLRPLRQKAESRSRLLADEEATASFIAETAVWVPKLRPAPDRWLDLALIVDTSASMVVWRRTIAELRALLERLGAFRDVRVWSMDTDQDATPLPLRPESAGTRAMGRDPRELIDPSGRRVFLIFSDCVGAAWSSGAVSWLLERWGAAGPVAIVHPLPQRLWERCAPQVMLVRLRAPRPGAPNAELEVRARHGEADLEAGEVGLGRSGLAVPVMELESRWLGPWASLVAGTTHDQVDAMAMFTARPARPWAGQQGSATPGDDDPAPLDRLLRFRWTASPTAFQLAGCMAASPLSLPVMRLVQRVAAPASRPSHLAEFFLSGLLRRVSPHDGGAQHPEDVEYEFHDGVRELLLTNLRRSEALRILHEVSEYVSGRMGRTPLDFNALLAADRMDGVDLEATFGRPFAQVALTVLRSLGGKYADLADRLTGEQWQGDSVPAHDPNLEATRLRDVAAVLAQQAAPPGSAEVPDIPGEMVATFPSVGVAEHGIRQREQPVVFEGVPPRNPNFTGREELIRQLREVLGGSVTALLPQALQGLGGVGKTQLAVEYAHRHATEYDVVAWIPAEDPTVIRSSIARLAPALEIAAGGEIAHTVAAVLDALRRGRPYDRWLLIFDNAGRPQELTEFLPSASGHVIVTSRDQSWANIADTIEVDVFSRQESIRLLSRRGQQSISPRDADRLAEKLGDLPLALDQAAVWHAQTGMPVDEYLRLLDERLNQLLADEAPSGDYPHSVATTWRVGLDRLQSQHPAAAQLLRLCSFLGPGPIPTKLLYQGGVILPEPLRSTVRDDVLRRRAVRELGRSALAKIDPLLDRLQVHRLVQAVIRETLEPTERAATRRAVHELLAAADPGDPDDPGTWDQYADLARHTVFAGLVDGETADVRNVLVNQMRYLYRRGDYEGCRDLGQSVSGRWRETLGPDDRQTLTAHRHLAIALRAMGQSETARKLNEDSLERLRRVFGEDGEDTLLTANSYGADLRIRGMFAAARKLDADTRDRHRKVFGENHPRTLRSANNLAVNLRLLGEFDAAQELDEDTYSRRQQVLPKNNSEILSSAGNLARDLFARGEYSAARLQLEDTLGKFRSWLGEDHPDVLWATRFQAVILRKLGLHGEARELAERNLELYKARLGESHLQTIAAMTSLANDLRMAGELWAARTCGEDALARYRRILGEGHLLTHVCAIDLAIVLRALSEAGLARELDERARTALRRLFSEDHPFALCCASNLSNDLYLAEEYQAARDLSKQTHERSVRVRGVDHPDTLACATNLMIDLRACGDDKGAQRLGEDTLVRLRTRLGEYHPDTLAAAEGRRAECDIEPPGL